MRTAGIIAEFNPFHNGHKYLIEKAKENADAAVVVMSGSFVQRGGIAVTDKWTRAKHAVSGGADLVIELPVTFSMNTAQKFAQGAVDILNAAGIVDVLFFGSECGDTEKITQAAELILNEPPEVSKKLQSLLQSGLSYPAARAAAYSEHTAVLSSPNDILGVEYVRAIMKINSKIRPYAIRRTGVEHDSVKTAKNIASASKIRGLIQSGSDFGEFIPTYGDFNVYYPQAINTAAVFLLRTTSAQYLKTINDVTEGIENRFLKAAAEYDNLEDICMAVKSKRYPLSRIRRIAYSALLGLTNELCALPPSYIRVLAMNGTGKQLLREMKKRSSLPVIIKAADFKGDEIFDANKKAEDVFALCSSDPARRKGNLDLTTSPIII